MLNRNDRIALRKSRATVNWLIMLVFILIFWLISLYREKRMISGELELANIHLSECGNLAESQKNRIDSLKATLVNTQKVDTPSIVKTPTFIKVTSTKDTTKKINKTIQKDTLANAK